MAINQLAPNPFPPIDFAYISTYYNAPFSHEYNEGGTQRVKYNIKIPSFNFLKIYFLCFLKKLFWYISRRIGKIFNIEKFKA